MLGNAMERGSWCRPTSWSPHPAFGEEVVPAMLFAQIKTCNEDDALDCFRRTESTRRVGVTEDPNHLLPERVRFRCRDRTLFKKSFLRDPRFGEWPVHAGHRSAPDLRAP